MTGDGQSGNDAAPPSARTPRSSVTLLDQARFLQQVLLELGDVVQGRLGVLLAGDGKVELVLLLGQQLEELRHVPDVLLPIELTGPRPGSTGGRSRISDPL